MVWSGVIIAAFLEAATLSAANDAQAQSNPAEPETAAPTPATQTAAETEATVEPGTQTEGTTENESTTVAVPANTTEDTVTADTTATEADKASNESEAAAEETIQPREILLWMHGRANRTHKKFFNQLRKHLKQDAAWELVTVRGKQRNRLARLGRRCQQAEECLTRVTGVAKSAFIGRVQFVPREKPPKVTFELWATQPLTQLSRVQGTWSRRTVDADIDALLIQTTEVLTEAETPPEPIDEPEAPALVQNPENEREMDWDVDDNDPYAAHGAALAAELDGDIPGALRMLRKAHAASADDEMIAFDLARVAYEYESSSLAKDAEPFLNMPATSADGKLMQAYILMRLQRDDEATARVEQAAAVDPANGEATRLTARMAPREASEENQESRLTLRARAITEVDSNVTVLPSDSPSLESGIRAGTAALARTELVDDRLYATLRGQYAAHLNDRSFLSLYDVGATGADLSFKLRPANWVLTVGGLANLMFIDGFGREFMREYGARFDARGRDGKLEMGINGFATVRDFKFQNPEGRENDRDGIKTEISFLMGWREGPWRWTARLGVHGEFAQGDQQYEQGILGGGHISWVKEPWVLRVGLDYYLRDYPRSRDAEPDPITGLNNVLRTDHRLVPNFYASYELDRSWSVFGSYTLTRNISAGSFDYLRHVGQSGVQYTW